MAMQFNTLRPGYLVSLKTTVSGNVRYEKTTIEAEHLAADGSEVARWETQRVISDPVEAEQAKIARGKARSTVTRVCAASAFGLLCPESAAADLEKAIKDAREIAEAFNATAKLTRIGVYVITGRIAPDDVEAVRAINSEVRDLMSAMQDGIRTLDVAAVREAANKARGLGSMLSPDAQARITIAIEAARKSARQIAKAGEQAAQAIDLRAIAAITEARTAFLDMAPAAEVATPTVDAPAIDFAPSEPGQAAQDEMAAEDAAVSQQSADYAAEVAAETIVAVPFYPASVPAFEMD